MGASSAVDPGCGAKSSRLKPLPQELAPMGRLCLRRFRMQFRMPANYRSK